MLENQVLTIDAASRLLRVSIPKARRLLRRMGVPRVGVGHDACYRTGDVVRAAREVEVNDEPLPAAGAETGRE